MFFLIIYRCKLPGVEVDSGELLWGGDSWGRHPDGYVMKMERRSEEWRWWFGARVRRGMEREKSERRGIADMAKSEKYRGPVVPSPGGSDTFTARNARGWAKHAFVINNRKF